MREHTRRANTHGMREICTRTIAPAAFVATALVLASGAGAKGSFGVDADPAPHVRTAKQPPSPTRLWYRISATVEQTREGESFETRGNDPAVRVTRQYRATVKYRLRSRHAVLLYRQCLPLGAAEAVDPKFYAKSITNGRSTTGCAAARAFLRRYGASPAEIRELRLVEDVRFTANAEGFLDEYKVGTAVPAHTYRFSGAGGFIPGTVTCPAQTVGIYRVTGLPLAFEARFQTGSAVRDGVRPAFALPRPPVGVETGGEGGPCISDPDGPREGRPVSEPRLHAGPGLVFLQPTAYGTFPATPAARFRTGTRFGKVFTIDTIQTIVEPVSPARQTGPWVTTVVVKLKFTPCPRGGRDVPRC